MYTVKVKQTFKDIDNNYEQRRPGDIIKVDNSSRLKTLMGDNQIKVPVVELISATKRATNQRQGKKIYIYQGFLYYIGGIETFLYNLTKYYQDRNITILCKRIDVRQFINLSKYADIELDNGGNYECDILILGNYDCDSVLPRIKAEKIYQMMHGDLRGLKTYLPGGEQNFKWIKNIKIDQIISVSQAASDGLKEVTGYDSEVIYNILDDNFAEEDGAMSFITLSRATPEKGINRIIQMAEAFIKADKQFVWFLCCSLEQIKDREILKKIQSLKQLVIVPPSHHMKALIKNCDYLVQLSDTESFCYSAFEALQRNVPVILTNFPEAQSIVVDGENGYILEMDLSNLDVEKIFTKKPKATHYIDRCDHTKWEKVFKGEL